MDVKNCYPLIATFLFCLGLISSGSLAEESSRGGKYAQMCFDTCRDRSNKDFVVCMANCRACGDVCDGLQGIVLDECRDRCGIVMNRLEDSDIQLKRLVMAYEARVAFLKSEETFEVFFMSVDPKVMDYAATMVDGDPMLFFTVRFESLVKIMDRFFRVYKDCGCDGVDQIQDMWNRFRGSSTYLLEEELYDQFEPDEIGYSELVLTEQAATAIVDARESLEALDYYLAVMTETINDAIQGRDQEDQQNEEEAEDEQE